MLQITAACLVAGLLLSFLHFGSWVLVPSTLLAGVVVAVFAIHTGFGWWSAFGLVVLGAVLLQIGYLLGIATIHWFPSSNESSPKARLGRGK